MFSRVSEYRLIKNFKEKALGRSIGDSLPDPARHSGNITESASDLRSVLASVWEWRLRPINTGIGMSVRSFMMLHDLGDWVDLWFSTKIR